MAKKERKAYDVRALWYLWRDLRGRTYRAPGYPADSPPPWPR